MMCVYISGVSVFLVCLECQYLSTSLPAGGPVTPGHPQPVDGRHHPAGHCSLADLSSQTRHRRVDDEGDEEQEDRQRAEQQGHRSRAKIEFDLLPPRLLFFLLLCLIFIVSLSTTRHARQRVSVTPSMLSV